MTFTGAISRCFRKYVTFSGRAGRPEYWWFFLFILLGSLVTGVLDSIVFGTGTDAAPATQMFSPLFSLVTFLPLLAAGWRRMHDSGRPGWYLLLPVIVSMGAAVVLLFGAVGAVEMEQAGVGGDALEGAAAGAGLTSIIVMFAIQLVMMVLTIWWLTRPSDPGENRFGPPPA